jgi:SAM-dependent methyltransferase
MGAYEEFDLVYDIFQDNVDYEAWASYLQDRLTDFDIRDGLVLDLGCGTGTMTELLASAGYDMIGVDGSEEMLLRAAEKRAESGHSILYLLQDMTEFELYGTVRAVVSVCDSLNYLLEEEELLQTFRLVNNYLDPGGIFIFDMNTEYKYRELLGSCTIAENREEGSFIWENDYDEDSGINEYDLTLFVRREDGLYEKSEEVHYQKAWRSEKVKELLKAAGMTVIAVYDAYTQEPPRPDSDRLTFIAREKGKQAADIND